MMSKVFISRPDGSVPWGFRLQGGFEYSEPLMLTNVAPNSPAAGKIDSGDILIEIAGNNVTRMTHDKALELIQHCGNALYLTLYKVGHSYPVDKIQRSKFTEQQHQPSDGYNVPSVFQYNIPLHSTSKFITNIPSASMLDTYLTINTKNSLASQQPFDKIYPFYEQSMDISNMPPIFAKNFDHSSGPKPFTYTPGGLDRSKLTELAGIGRHREHSSTGQERQGIDPTMNRRTIVPSEQLNQHHYAAVNPIQPFSYAHQQPTPPKKHIQHDTDVITQSRSFQMLQEWISDSEKTKPIIVSSSLTQSITTPTEVQTSCNRQNKSVRRRSSSSGLSSLPSRSFRYLQDQYNADNDNATDIAKAAEVTIKSSDGTGLRRSSDVHNPSRAFKYLQDQYHISQALPINRSQAINSRDDLIEIYHKLPPSFRPREPEAPRYTGSTVPSRSFRFLQMMTQDDEQNDSKPTSGYIKPQPILFNKYDERNIFTDTNKLHEHPSRSFRYLQEMTGEQKSIINKTERQSGTLKNSLDSTNIGASDF